MKKFVKAAFAAVLAMGMSACGSSSTAETIEKSVYQIETDGSYDEYIVVYYTSDRNALTGMTDEVHFYKESGYTADMFSPDSIKSVYPDFDSYDFASVDIQEDDNTIYYIVHFKNLDNHDNAVKAAEAELIKLEDKDGAWLYVDAKGILDSLKAIHKEIPAADIDSLGLHFQ